MDNPPALVKITAATAVEICKNFELKEEARPLLKEPQTPREFLDSLLAGKRHAAAIDFLAHALPPREAIWWGCLCLQHAVGSNLPPVEATAAKAAAKWVLDPSEENRKAAQAPGEAARVGTPAGCLAMAVAWTSGSLAPPIPQPHAKAPPIPPVPPGPYLPAKAVAGAVMLAAVKAEPARIVDTQRLFVELGIGVAEARFVWPEVQPQAQPQKVKTGTWTIRT
jgi:hypothetical protein